MTHEKKDEINFELKPVLVCKKCGRENHAGGNYTHHRAGTVSFQIYNADKDCIWCKMEAEKAKAEKELEQTLKKEKGK